MKFLVDIEQLGFRDFGIGPHFLQVVETSDLSWVKDQIRRNWYLPEGDWGGHGSLYSTRGITIYPLGGDPTHLSAEDLDKWVRERRDLDEAGHQERSEESRRNLYNKLKEEFGP